MELLHTPPLPQTHPLASLLSALTPTELAANRREKEAFFGTTVPKQISIEKNPSVVTNFCVALN